MKYLYVFLISVASLSAKAQHRPVSLAGTWSVKLDSSDKGMADKWFLKSLDGQIKLPGTLDDAGLGMPVKTDTSLLSKEIMLHLARRYRYTGAAWYQKIIHINKGMTDAAIYLERVIWKAECWIDGRPAGSQESLIAPHTFSIGKLAPGKHIITLRIDNRKLHDISFNDFAHAYTDGTQIIWNGVIGRMELVDNGPATIQSVMVTGNPDTKQISASVKLHPETNNSLYLQSRVILANHTVLKGAPQPITKDSVQHLTFSFPRAKLWDEFSPNVYKLEVEVTDRKGKVLSSQTERFGFRKIGSKGSELRINGRPLFLRGTLECNIFPLEGHPPMDAPGWIKVFSAAKLYGLNHLRFHSWCPPEAAFRVADSLGFYLHVELPLWSLNVGKDKPTVQYLEDEAELMIKNYGNHPSFCFWSMGNELEGDFLWLERLVRKLKKEDSRHLYTTTTFSFQKGHGKSPEPADDFFITQYTDKGWVRGQGIFNTNTPDFKTDYSHAVKGTSVPLIIHEVGQYSVFPDLTEISKYTGVLVPANFSAVRYDLQKKGMLKLAASYLKASGSLSANLYKEEIERALKTKGVGGFQLLDLHDFPGQGTALVGILNAFWDSKGIISPAAFRQFCGPAVPLLRFDKAAYTNNEIFLAEGEFANYTDEALNGELIWTISNDNQKVLFKGSFGSKLIPIGNSEALGKISVPLHGINRSQQLQVTLQLAKSKYVNSWKIWVYPDQDNQLPANVHFTTSLDTAVKLLNSGASVILNPDTASINGIDGRFAPVFWSPVHFPDQPGSMGLLIDNHHPALADFPTNFYTDWQWWDLITRSRSVSLDQLDHKPAPIVRVIDNFFKNRNLANLIEFQVGKGKLILCTMDLHSDLIKRPAARQLKKSLISYAASSKFLPVQTISIKELATFMKILRK
ncbi:glycoside hydrolase family 2 TIM barrel-domain containing protein [Mucilaginibacter sp. 10I4]|uniref:glycoside hydrolase family 2 TIM barrel-domain containing protein n=1 Tax=Mucilaginibacter sp. 10I4 TaxID=3048580 RepID=UPI002B2299ED|nr:glycoside hydrolase family 2 TIM barrel-domain containing protein [Mucilaginibacter sp. 10I4]MEB0262046.1 glycoside hydrolase family 2 TIM barrel-domain containing protein [Mucilaginibacter sp. 10I4]